MKPSRLFPLSWSSRSIRNISLQQLAALGLINACTLALFLPALASAQTPTQAEPRDGIVFEVDNNQRPKIKLAFPASKRPVGASPQVGSAIDELEATLRNDLRLSGVFTIQGPRELSGLALTGERANDFEQYRSLGNEMVLLNEVKLEGTDKIVLEGTLYDLGSRQLILGKRYAATTDLSRRVAHTFNDEIVFYMTGVRGIAGTSIAFTSDRDEGQGIKELYLMDYDGYGQRKMSGHRSLSFSPAWSPNGDGLAYVSYYSGSGASLYWVDRASGRKSVILEEDAQALSPSVSPDGRHIAFGRSLKGNLEIFTIKRDGSDLKRLTTSGGIDTNPAWSPKGDRIAFTSSRSGSPQIYVMDRSGDNVRRLTFESSYNDGAAWDPEGRFIVFAARTPDGGRFDIAKLDVETGEQTRLTAGPGSHEAPSFSPDGRFIVYESNRSGKRQVYLMAADGEPVAQLTNGSNNFGPSWSGYFDN